MTQDDVIKLFEESRDWQIKTNGRGIWWAQNKHKRDYYVDIYATSLEITYRTRRVYLYYNECVIEEISNSIISSIPDICVKSLVH